MTNSILWIIVQSCKGAHLISQETAATAEAAATAAAESPETSATVELAATAKAAETPDAESAGERLECFRGIIARLRAPGGCPWDAEQTHESIAHNMVEEAFEAVDAIERGNTDDLREELGDVLLQVVFQSQMASEAGEFTLSDVIGDISDKMIRRHPHVFGDEAAFAAAHLSEEQIAQIKGASTPDKVLDLWDQIKIVEGQRKAEKAELLGIKQPGLLDGIPPALPALMQAQDISRKAVAAGFEWPDVASVWAQVESELEEYRAAKRGTAHAEEEFGDILFSLVNVARKEGIDAESALRATCRKFRRRWAIMEQYANEEGQHVSSYPFEGLEELWDKAKENEEGSR